MSCFFEDNQGKCQLNEQYLDSSQLCCYPDGYCYDRINSCKDDKELCFIPCEKCKEQIQVNKETGDFSCPCEDN
jgi:hypothetical protein